MKHTYICSYARTPIGAFQGSLSKISAISLGALVIKAVVDRASISIENINEVIMGNVLSANLGQAPARHHRGAPPRSARRFGWRRRRPRRSAPQRRRRDDLRLSLRGVLAARWRPGRVAHDALTATHGHEQSRGSWRPGQRA